MQQSTLSSLDRRRNMVDCQLRTFDVTDLAVQDAFLVVPRERFLGQAIEIEIGLHLHGPLLREVHLSPRPLTRTSSRGRARFRADRSSIFRAR